MVKATDYINKLLKLWLKTNYSELKYPVRIFDVSLNKIGMNHVLKHEESHQNFKALLALQF